MSKTFYRLFLLLTFFFSLPLLIHATEIDTTSLQGKKISFPEVIGFTESYLNKAFGDSTNNNKSKAIGTFDQLESSKKYVDNLKPSDLNELPIGMQRTISNITYTIAVSSAVFNKDYAELTVYAKVKIPQKDYPLFFGLSGLKLSYQGGIIGDAKLVLLGDMPISINGGNAAVILKGGLDMTTGQAMSDLTYITMDCSGFRQMGIAADVVFPRSLLIPCNAKGDAIPDESQKVKGAFKTVISDWNDILVTIDLPKFQINNLKDVVFTVSKATFDFSDTRNSSNVTFPKGYELKYMNYPNPNMWRGLYIQTLDITLPKAFAKRGSTDRVAFGANNLIIDNNGVSGSLYGKNVLSFNEGSASGWKFSVDEFRLNLEANNLTAAGFKGKISIPTANNDSLKYEAVITADNKYWLTVSPKSMMEFNIWQAKVDLDSNSYVKLMVDNDKFLPEANLSGRMSISAKTNPNSQKSLADFKGITFRGLRLKTQNPYLTVNYFGYNGEVKIANFPVSVDSIVLVAGGNRADLSFGIKLTLMDGKFKADTRLNLTAKFNENNGLQSWDFDRVRLSEIDIKGAKIGGLTLDGKIQFLEDDPIYGNGFGGGIHAKFEALKGMDITVRARFGKTSFRYWFVDAKVDLGVGLPIPPVLMIHGFAGGAYYRMSKMDPNSGSFAGGLLPAYKPDSVMGLGIKAGLMFSVSKREVCDGMVEFEVAFNRNGGLNYIGFFGNAKFMGKLPFVGGIAEQAGKLIGKIEEKASKALEGLSDVAKSAALQAMQIKKINDPQGAAKDEPMDNDFTTGIAAYLGMHYDFPNQTFHANFDIYINTAKGLLQGIGNNYRAGWAVMHFAPSEWYVYIGTPSDPMGIQFALGSFKLKTESYIMLGTKIPGSPPPPQEVADILGLQLSELDYMRDLNSLGEGKGFAFGARLSVQTGDITFLILYANFSAGVGFDLMLKEYPDAHCEGESSPIGIHGWYANAQAYVYLQGELGIKVDLFFIKAKIPIISGGAAALMQAKLPNPSWFRGYLGVKFSVLGGLISGRANFKVQLGKECKIVNAGPEPPLGIKVISDITPKDTVNADVFTAPQVAFNFPVEKDIPIIDEKGNRTFRVKLEKFELTQNKNQISGSLQWNAGQDAVTFYSDEVLPQNSTVKAYVKVSFVELIGGSWQTVYMDNKKAEEDRTINFTTGLAPISIPLTNIVYNYPVVDQRNLYKDESSKAYIRLRRGQTYLFKIPGFQHEVQLKSGKNTTPVAFEYDSLQRTLGYPLPSLLTGTDYSFNLISRPITSSNNGGSSKTAQKLTNGTDSLQVDVKSSQAQDVVQNNGEKVLLTYNFHTSAHATFASKINSLVKTQSIYSKLSSDVIDLRQNVSPYEAFDVPEISGTMYTSGKPLLQPVALLNNTYYSSDIFPLNYQKYPINGNIYISNRDTVELGLHPVKALPISLSYQTAIEQGNFNSQFANQTLPYIYDLGKNL